MELRRSSRLKTHATDHDQSEAPEEPENPAGEPVARTQLRKRRRTGAGANSTAAAPSINTRAKMLGRPPYGVCGSDLTTQGPMGGDTSTLACDVGVVNACRDKLLVLTEKTTSGHDVALSTIISQAEGLAVSLLKLQAEDQLDQQTLLQQIKLQVQSSGKTMNDSDVVLTQTLGNSNLREEAVMKFVAQLHGIDMQDVADIAVPRDKNSDRPSTKRNDFQLINNRINRMLVRERDISLHWPDKRRKPPKKSKSTASSPLPTERLDTFDDVALFS
ncbi:LAFE_0G13872g1_1 [Lachancea fermentati]|uniref:LAFE_0G13872g1_1 n=1 Tax=Lachancea fermentati TaxID=4955 RepID=A0A1G4MIK9_LACFM|nr:LAFE_0G13872g1_1 [Lachancea fermentati]